MVGGSATVNIFDGTRQAFPGGNILITVMDGNHNLVDRKFHNNPSVDYSGLPVFDNFGDNYTFVASADGYKDAGFVPVHIAEGVRQIVDLMLIPKSNSFDFSKAGWNDVAGRPALRDFLIGGDSDSSAAQGHYNDLKEVQGGAVLACLLNITTAAGQIHLPQDTVLNYLKAVIWDLSGTSAMAQDRFYGWANPAILQQLETAKQQGKFAPAPFALHPGATKSYKQIEFGEANVQLTFHENDRHEVKGVNCIKIEPDIDYFRDAAAHLLLEVAVNAFGSVTDPRVVYALRWIAGRRAGVPEFDPLYTIVKA